MIKATFDTMQHCKLLRNFCTWKTGRSPLITWDLPSSSTPPPWALSELSYSYAWSYACEAGRWLADLPLRLDFELAPSLQTCLATTGFFASATRTAQQYWHGCYGILPSALKVLTYCYQWFLTCLLFYSSHFFYFLTLTHIFTKNINC